MGNKRDSAASDVAVVDSLTVSVIGLGYIGLPTATMFASTGVRVLGVDVSPHVVDTVNRGKIHIEEDGLDALVEKFVESGYLSASLTPEPANAFIVAVPTPVSHDEAHLPDVSYIQAAGRAIAPVLKSGDLIILESTSPVGTTGMLAELLAGLRRDLTFPQDAGEDAQVQLAYCPERIIPGRMLQELVENDRIIGGMTKKASQQAIQLYGRFVKGACIESDDRTAELVKLTENAFRDVNIAFANELSMLCDDLSLNVWDVIRFANRHPRVSILSPGPGVGGHCIAVDPWFIVASSPDKALLIRTAREVNDSKPDFVTGKVSQIAKTNPDLRIACLGLTYKADVDDFRESPSLDIAKRLTLQYPGRVVCHDPFFEALPDTLLEGVALEMVGLEKALAGADVVLVLVGHKLYAGVSAPDGAEVVDTVGFWQR
jgi:UDP-N-acetyl-D-mannosaminuronic acid dehydrogenase